MKRLFLLSLCVCGPAVAAAQSPGTLVGADEGGARVTPIARLAAGAWVASCQAPAKGAASRGTLQRPALVAGAGTATDRIRYVPRGGPEWQRLEPVVERLFAQRERQEDVAPATLARVPTIIDAISAAQTGTPTYFFRASKTIPDTRGEVDPDEDGDVDPPGDLRLEVIGWLRGGDRTTSIGTNATLSWEQVDGRPAGTGSRRPELHPIGIVRTADAQVWVMQVRAGESRWFALYTVGAAGVRPTLTSDPRTC